ncbi:hypothetical protein [Methylobacterium sp. WL12]|uniref:hypothetical protein n=1 Tax=Methylobacterium sp. WL12 TaxID=2603890 RepID=UPI00164FB593|nr:hypothetical protein [Methylobacterium sp. WL12]
MHAFEVRAAVMAVPPMPALRRSLSPWAPSAPSGPYKLPHDVQDRLTAALRDFRNRDAAAALAAFLGRFWSTPARLVLAFPIDRRALTDHAALDLTEARVRGAIATLKAIGFLDPDPLKGSGYRATEVGLHRKPVLFRFGSGYREAFASANARSRAARGKTAPVRRPIATPPATTRPAIPPTQLAQRQDSPVKGLIMGEHGSQPDLDQDLAAALDRLKRAIEREHGQPGAPYRQADPGSIRGAL